MIDFVKLSLAADRDWAITDSLTVDRYAAIVRAWQFSQMMHTKIAKHLAGVSLPESVVTLAVAGSLARMDAAEVSDCDLLVILTPEALTQPDKGTAVFDKVWDALASLNLTKPKSTGTFSQPTSLGNLCDTEHVGAANEDMRSFAKRLLLLLESQPVYRPDGYEQALIAVLDIYASGYVDKDPKKEWVFLINDLIRYFRSICVNYQWDFHNEHGKWQLRNIKLRHSRLIMYCGLLFLLGEASTVREDKVTWLRHRLKLTPLERIAWVYAHNADHSFYRLAGFYNTFLDLLSQTEVRDELNGAKVGSYGARYEKRHYALLKANSDGLIAELLRFVLSQRGTWTERFFEYLLF